MTETELAVARYKATYGNKLWRVQNLYKIRTKDRKLVRLEINTIQRMIIDKTKDMDVIRAFILKYRQGGVSTFWLIWWLDEVIHHRNTIAGVLADLRENLGYLWEIVRLAYDTMPERLRPRLGDDSKSVLTFPDLNSKMMVSLSFKSTPLHILHISEWAFCDETAIAQSIGGCSPDTHITGETTPNGVGNDAYITYWDAKDGTNGYRDIFVPWWLQPEYRLPLDGVKIIRTREESKLPIDDEQVMFRRVTSSKLKKEFIKYYPEDDETCWLMSGLHYFDSKKVLALLREARDWAKTNKPVEETEDYIRWEDYDKDCIYAAGADVAEGIDVGSDAGRDYSVLVVFNVTKRRPAFRFKARVGVDVFYKVCAKWGNYFGHALLAVERNNHGHAVLLGLRENSRYTNLYVQKPDTRVVVKGALGHKEVIFGWRTDQITKPLMCDQFRYAVEGDSSEDEQNFSPEFMVLDQELCKEMLTYEEVEGKLGAAQGKHDDLVIGYAIAFQMYLILRRRERIDSSMGAVVGAKRDSADSESRKGRREAEDL